VHRSELGRSHQLNGTPCLQDETRNPYSDDAIAAMLADEMGAFQCALKDWQLINARACITLINCTWTASDNLASPSRAAKSRIREKSRTPDVEQPARRMTAEERQWQDWADAC
jgi:hypothetical protein